MYIVSFMIINACYLLPLYCSYPIPITLHFISSSFTYLFPSISSPHLSILFLLINLSIYLYKYIYNSIQWIVEDLIVEYCMQIESHFAKLLSSIQSNHWRTNPIVLSGSRVAIFRKSTATNPTFLTG